MLVLNAELQKQEIKGKIVNINPKEDLFISPKPVQQTCSLYCILTFFYLKQKRKAKARIFTTFDDVTEEVYLIKVSSL